MRGGGAGAVVHRRLLPNFAAATGAERIARSYDQATLAVLTGLAAKYDPANVLRAGQVPVR
jgi:hypothetical protein